MTEGDTGSSDGHTEFARIRLLDRMVNRELGCGEYKLCHCTQWMTGDHCYHCGHPPEEH